VLVCVKVEGGRKGLLGEERGRKEGHPAEEVIERVRTGCIYRGRKNWSGSVKKGILKRVGKKVGVTGMF